MKKILIPTDYSDSSYKAIRFALSLAKRADIDLIFLHVMSSFFLPNHSGEMSYEDIIKGEQELQYNKLHEVIRSLLQELNIQEEEISIQIAIGINEIDKNIIDTAIKSEVDLIIMGTHGATGLKRLLFGTNTSEVMRHSPIPILAIPDKVEMYEINKILIASDFKVDEESKAFNTLIDIVNLYQAELTIFHVLNDQGKVPDFKSLNLVKHQFYFSAEEDVIEAIHEINEEVKPDLLVLFPNKHRLLDRLTEKSVTEKITLDAYMPLLTIPR